MGASLALNAGPPAGLAARVYIRTLGVTQVWRDGVLVRWVGNGAGKRQLRREFGCLVGFVGGPVTYRVLKEVAGGRQSGAYARPYYMVGGLIRLLRSLGMGDALHRGDYQLTLMPHPLWRSDVDELRELRSAARSFLEQQEPGGAIDALERALRYCGDHVGHRFLRELLDCRPVAERLRRQADEVTDMQRDTLHQLARLYLATSSFDRWECALTLAKHALTLPHAGDADLDLAAEAAERCGRMQEARRYRRWQ